ncbi:C40 family peptidase [Robiginitomaculum antarcticum]|uniref:C40 family peptidase n=1 Tax=Robiginitomaculum antarcticum TaxID=437507 RepID=UPI0003637152|nr:NlpC/P60 family protein [Robiginitomaculum antarcticum]
MSGDIQRCIAAVSNIYDGPDDEAALEDQVLFGHAFEVTQQNSGWLSGQSLDVISGDPVYKGWVRAADFAEDFTPTHKIKSLRAPVFSRADIKSPIVMSLSLGSRLRAAKHNAEFYETVQGFVHARHVAIVDNYAGDFVDVAALYLNLPYVWGGKSANGVDCSGLVQNALWATGLASPRDSGPQGLCVGEALTIESGFANLRRGDLVFWPGHVGIMEDSTMLLHANGYHMMTAREPLTQAASRIKKTAGDITSIRRL